MAAILATVGSEAGSKLFDIGYQLTLLGGIALFLGALRLRSAARSPGRSILTAGLLLFALGLTVQTLEHLGAIENNYYPGWKADLEETFLRVDPDLEFSEDDLEVDFGEPRWWSGLLWWGERVFRLVGMGLAMAGFVLDGRAVLQGARRSRRRAGR